MHSFAVSEQPLALLRRRTSAPLLLVALAEQAHRTVEGRCASHVAVGRPGLLGGEQRLIGGGVVATAVFHHTERQQAPIPHFGTLTGLNCGAAERQRRFVLAQPGTLLLDEVGDVSWVRAELTDTIAD